MQTTGTIQLNNIRAYKILPTLLYNSQKYLIALEKISHISS
ncbi:hypothetical protein EMUCRT_0454 [Ehrlichia cf. muris str. EmCRT]|uniref:Uncharacterized protein n=1 Tax=Ehrlichia cf. muris str. EmCRT TaxID=1359167 RepID=A0A0F3NBT2_9RICK|nr:hypothetical protein EMUCRT_0454 [Ehrlichia cf. muris str. EmCRT]